MHTHQFATFVNKVKCTQKRFSATMDSITNFHSKTALFVQIIPSTVYLLFHQGKFLNRRFALTLLAFITHAPSPHRTTQNRIYAVCS